MGSRNSAVKALQVVENVERVLGIELMNAAQALQFRLPLKTSEQLEKLLTEFRDNVPFIEQDEVMRDHMEEAWNFVRNYPSG